MTLFSDSTTSDWDNAQSESLTHHEQPANTDWAASDVVELGLPTYDENGSTLEAYWPFDENSGSTAYDVSGNGRDGELAKGVTVDQPGIRGSTSYLSDGVDNVVDTTWAGIGGSTNRTFECWVKTSTGSDQSLISYGDQDVAGAKWLVRIDEASTAGDWVLRVEVASGFLRGTTHIADGNWHHVACVLEGSDCTDHTLYVDGTAETVDDSAAQAVDTDTTAEDVTLLRRPATWGGSGGRTLDGLMDEPRVYSRALSQSEIQSHAHGDTPTGSLTGAVRTISNAGLPTEITTSSSLGGGSIDVVVNEDTDQDGVAENTQTVSLAGGTDETHSLSGFDGGSDVDYWVEIQQSVTNPTDTAPTLDSYTVTLSATATGQSASVFGPGATTTTTRTAPTTPQSLAEGSAGATTTTTRTSSPPGQALAETSPGASTTTTRTTTATGSALAAFGRGAQGGLTDLTRAIASRQALAATGGGATTSPTAIATATGQPLAGFGDGAQGISGDVDIALATGQSLAARGSAGLGYGEGLFGYGAFGGEGGAPVTTVTAATATGGTLAASGTGARGGITHAIAAGQALAPSPDGASTTTTRTATTPGQALATSPTGSAATTIRTATTPGQSLVVWPPGARAAGFVKNHATLADTITATTAFEAEPITATTISETEWIGATVNAEAELITATTAFESEPIAATVAFKAEKLISEIHRSTYR